MPANGADSTAFVLSPLAQVLLTIFGGATVAALGGLFGAWIQGRRDHAKWVREQRYEAFITAIMLLRQVALLTGKANELAAKGALPNGELDALSKKATDSIAGWPEASAPLALLGPDGVDESLGVAAKALRSNDQAVLRAAEQTLLKAMRAALAIK